MRCPGQCCRGEFIRQKWIVCEFLAPTETRNTGWQKTTAWHMKPRMNGPAYWRRYTGSKHWRLNPDSDPV
jgi:hypothetical protein